MPAPIVRLETRKRCLRAGEGLFPCRSEAPFRFLARLWWQHTRQPAQPWVTVDELGMCLGTATHPRQLLRTVDWLEKTGLGLIAFETRTRGRYRLACEADRLRPDLGSAALGRWLGLDEAGGEAEEAGALVGDALDHTVQLLLRADSGFNDGELRRPGTVTALPALLTDANPLWTALLTLRQAQVALRQGDYPRMESLLSEIHQGVRSGSIRQSHLAARADLLAARAHHDRGNLREAERLLRRAAESIAGDVWTEGRYHDLVALVAYGRWREAVQPGAPLDAAAVEALGRLEMGFSAALACQMQVMDYQGVQLTACNLAQALLSPAIFGCPHPEAASWAGKGLGWLAQSFYISQHFYVGMDSVMPQVLALQVAAGGVMEFSQLNELTQQMFGKLPDIEAAWTHIYRLARQIGNPAELDALHVLRRRLPARSFS